MIRSANREEIAQAVEELACSLRANHPEVERVIWFGSWVTGLPTPGSDVDLCLILSSSDEPLRDRVVAYLPVGFPVGIDLLAYTRTEFALLPEVSPSLYAAIASGMEM